MDALEDLTGLESLHWFQVVDNGLAHLLREAWTCILGGCLLVLTSTNRLEMLYLSRIIIP